jgi:hypothetical protein
MHSKFANKKFKYKSKLAKSKDLIILPIAIILSQNPIEILKKCTIDAPYWTRCLSKLYVCRKEYFMYPFYI